MGAVIVLVLLGMVFAFLLFAVSKIFHVPIDERVARVEEMLPGANCGGCGCAGCADFAVKLVKGELVPANCPVSSEEQRRKIAEFLGISHDVGDRFCAFVHCGGGLDKAVQRAEYHGVRDCLSLDMLLKGDKGCVFGCLGYGDCVRVCPFDAIHIVNGIAVVDRTKCTGCGKCVSACPRGIIELVPMKQKVFVRCWSTDLGKDVMPVCKVGCIACRRCEKECPVGAIVVTDNLARIDYGKCINCGKCVKVCPTKAIIMLDSNSQIML